MRRRLRVPPPERASPMRKMHIDATFLTSLFPRGPSNGWPLFSRHPFPLVHAAPACLPVCCQCRSPFPVTISPAALYRGTCPCSVPPRAPARGSGALPVTTAALPLPHSNGVVHAGCARSVGHRPAGDPAVLATWSSTSTSGLPPTAGRQPPPSPPAAHRGGATTSQQDRQPAPLPTKKNPDEKYLDCELTACPPARQRRPQSRVHTPSSRARLRLCLYAGADCHGHAPCGRPDTRGGRRGA